MLDSSGVISNKGRMAYWRRSSGWINNIYKFFVVVVVFVHFNSQFLFCSVNVILYPLVYSFSRLEEKTLMKPVLGKKVHERSKSF